MLSDKRLVAGFEGIPFVLIGVREKHRYGPDGKATENIEAVRVTAKSLQMGEITVDLYPYTPAKYERVSGYFGLQFTIEDIVAIEGCKIFVFQKDLRVTITAADIQPKIEI